MTALAGASCDAVLGIQRYGEPGGDRDATAVDGNPSDGGRDARPDSTKEEDHVIGEGGDAGMDTSTCVKIASPTTPTHGGPACTSSDGSACFPADETTFEATYVPTTAGTPHAKVCTATLVNDSYAACYGSGSTSTGCSAWVAFNGACATCIFSDVSASLYGAVIIEGAGSANGYTYPNVGGCVALAEPCNQGCAEAILADDLCGFAACSVGDGGLCASASETDVSACLAAADSTINCSCGGYIGYQGCIGALVADPAKHPAVSLCALTQTNFEVSYVAIATFMCGP